MRQPMVACDLDGVVANSFPAFEKWVLKKYGISFRDPVDLDAIPGEIFRFFQLPHLQNFPIRRGARTALSLLKRTGWRVVYVTVRPWSVRRITLQWFSAAHLPVDGVIFCDPHDNKLAIAVALGGIALVEDEIRHFTGDAHADIARILIGTKSPFIEKKNQRTLQRFPGPLPHPVVHAPRWSAVRQALERIAHERGCTPGKENETFLRVH